MTFHDHSLLQHQCDSEICEVVVYLILLDLLGLKVSDVSATWDVIMSKSWPPHVRYEEQPILAPRLPKNSILCSC